MKDITHYYLTTIMRNQYASAIPAFGKFRLAPENVELLPDFDLVLSLFVHHWRVKELGDNPAQVPFLVNCPIEHR